MRWHRKSRGAAAGAASVALSAALAGCGDAGVPFPASIGPEPGEELSGGETTVFDVSREAFTRPGRNLSVDHREDFALGDHFFNRTWITAPASAEGNDGLGPLYNATSCSACHFKDGRGEPPEPDASFVDLLLRLSVPGTDDHGGPLGEPRYGTQFNQFAILGVPSEGTPSLSYAEVAGSYADGEPYSLRQPAYAFPQLSYGPFAEGTMVSPRIAPQIPGLGLLEAVAEDVLLARVDEDDADRDGISGKANRVWDVERQEMVVGRFGWKAGVPTVGQQSMGAFAGDIGITSSLFGGDDCTAAQAECAAAPNGGHPELSDQKRTWITHYALSIAVPARRDWEDPEVLHGKALFDGAGCAGCHVPKLVTGTIDGFPELSGQVIRPYTDLLLHDMGEGLADGRPEFSADGREWRTAPLWAIGLVETVSRHQFLLHDGRARGFAEAILWHGGEAAASQERFREMSADDRAALLRFLESL
ncbi:MAG: di-heme oxidoredictase family protein [Polyangiaceae bacterium]